MKRFAKTIVKVLLAYADTAKKEFPQLTKDERIVSGPYLTAIPKRSKLIRLFDIRV